MSDIENPVARSDARIDVHDEAQCRHWSALLGIRPKELKHVVRMVGNRVSDVESFVAEAQLHEYFEENNTEANPT